MRLKIASPGPELFHELRMRLINLTGVAFVESRFPDHFKKSTSNNRGAFFIALYFFKRYYLFKV